MAVSARADKPMRIGLAGIGSESSTFSPHRTSLADFTVQRGRPLVDRYPWTSAADGWSGQVDWIPALHARALPGGPATTDAYEQLRGELLDRLRGAGPLDGVFLDLHGALNVVGYTDVEADLISAVREVVGPNSLLSASMDLHGNVSRRLATLLDLLTCYRTAPHVDERETRERAARNLVSRIRSGLGRPHKAWVPIPALLPGEKTSTRDEPARSIYASVGEAARRPGVIDAALWVGYAWADEPRCHAAVVVTGDDTTQICGIAGDLARQYWDALRDFQFVAPAGTLHDCLTSALGSTRRPFLISDSGDNPTAGGAGDVTFALRQLLATPQIAQGRISTIYASIVDPAAVHAMHRAGLGATVTLDVGGHVDAGHGGPVTVTGTVAALDEDDPTGGVVGVLRAGGLDLIVTGRRKPFHHVDDFTALGLDPARADLVVVKIGYLEPELYAIAADWMLALTPGGVDQDLLRLPYRHVARPMFPFDPAMDTPALAPELL